MGDKMKIMISQPMAGKSYKQIKKERENIIKSLESEGHEVIDTILDISEGLSPIYYLGEAIKRMAEVDAVVFMPGWENAKGCRIEHEIALEYGKYIKEVK